MNNLDEIKHALFSASDLSDALAKLDALSISYRECAVCDNTYHLIVEDVTFWAARTGHTLPVHVCIGDVIATADYREKFFAQQQPDLSQSVPAHDSPVAAEQPLRCQLDVVLLGKPQLHADDATLADSNFTPEQSTVFVHNSPRDWTVKAYPKTGGAA
jgi:hypothetical protein